MTQKQKRSFTLEDVVYPDGADVHGIPTVDEKFFGSYYAAAPSAAASKAYSSVIRYMKKYPGHYPQYKPDQSFVVSIVETTPGKNYGNRYTYLGTREPAPQSRQGARVITSPTGRVRSYLWANKMHAI